MGMIADQTQPADIEAISKCLRTHLNVFWLRPEAALVSARNHLLLPLKPTGCSIDLACGDGVYEFLSSGGEFDFSFDVYSSTRPASMREFIEGVDIYSHMSEDWNPSITKAPDHTFSYGLDIKNESLARASKLGLFRELVQHDMYNPLPFEDEYFDYIYSNSAYWISAVQPLFKEIRRVLRKNGTALIEVMTTENLRYDFNNLFPEYGEEWAAILNRGRFDTIPGVRSEAEWREVFDEASLKIEEFIDPLTAADFAIANVGLRPISPLLIKMTQALPEDLKLEIKREWVDTFHTLLLPILEKPEHLLPHRPHIRVAYVLSPR